MNNFKDFHKVENLKFDINKLQKSLSEVLKIKKYDDANGIKNFALGLWKTIKNAATALLKGLAKGPKMIANLVKNLPGLKAVAQGVKNVIGGVKSVGGKLISGGKNIGGKVVGKVKNVVGKGIKAVTSSKVFKNLQGGVSKVKNLAIKGFSLLRI